MNQTPTRVSKMTPSNQTPATESTKSGFKLKQPKLLMPYMKYTKRVWDDIKNKHPELKIWEISKIIGQMWRELDESEKAPYIMEYEREKVEYEREKLEYEKAKVAYEKSIQKSNENGDTSNKTITNEDSLDSVSKQAGKKHSRVSDPSLPKNISVKYHDRLVLSEMDNNNEPIKYELNREEIIEAQQRFNNNNQYMGTLFNQRQVDIPDKDDNKWKFYSTLQESLISFKSKLETQIDEINKMFSVEKRRREEEHEQFLENIQKKAKQINADELYQELLEKELEHIKKKVDEAKLNVNPDTAITKSQSSSSTKEATKTTNTPKDQSTNSSNVHNPDSIDIHDEDSASTEIDDEEMDSN